MRERHERIAAGEGGAGGVSVETFPPPPPRTKWTRRVPHPVLIGHVASLTPYMSPVAEMGAGEGGKGRGAQPATRADACVRPGGGAPRGARTGHRARGRGGGGSAPEEHEAARRRCALQIVGHVHAAAAAHGPPSEVHVQPRVHVRGLADLRGALSEIRRRGGRGGGRGGAAG